MGNKTFAVALGLLVVATSTARTQDVSRELDTRIQGVMPKVIQWRRDIHQHPELSNREVRTAKLVADHLRGLGLEVQTRRRQDRRRRRPARRAAGPCRRAPRGHGCAAGHRGR